MSDSIKGGFAFQHFIVTDFKINRNPVEQGEDHEIKTEIGASGQLNLSDRTYTLNLDIDILDVNESFEINMQCIGLFSFSENANIDELKPIFFLNAPAIVFPYMRAFIAGVTALSGLEAVNLPVTNLAFLREGLEKNTTYDVSDHSS